jgi:large subunit ribosomal protein L23
MKKTKITSSERALSIIKSPIMTEKSTTLNQFNKYSFFVSKDSNSIEIKQAIENIFKVIIFRIISINKES